MSAQNQIKTLFQNSPKSIAHWKLTMDEKPTFESKIDWENNYFIIKAIGNLNVDEIIDSLMEVIALSEFKPGMFGIWDLSQADLYDITTESIVELTERLSKITENFNDLKAAIVSEKGINLGLISLFIEYYPTENVEIKMFESMADAKSWILQ